MSSVESLIRISPILVRTVPQSRLGKLCRIKTTRIYVLGLPRWSVKLRPAAQRSARTLRLLAEAVVVALRERRSALRALATLARVRSGNKMLFTTQWVLGALLLFPVPTTTPSITLANRGCRGVAPALTRLPSPRSEVAFSPFAQVHDNDLDH